jgi:hypothetical protein
MLSELIKKRALPPLLHREEMLKLLLNEEYGNPVPKPDSIEFSVRENTRAHFCAGKAFLDLIDVRVAFGDKSFSFPVKLSRPCADGRHPLFIHINFRDAVPDLYMPTEELIDNGFAVLSFSYLDITSDDGDFTNGLAGVLYPDRKRGSRDAGKIAMWAWAASRVMDYAETRADIFDLSRAAVCGHSRLGKTALLAGALDERFSFVYSNDSGCSGAAISREKQGESVDKICTRFPYWFCEEYYKYGDKVDTMPFDQHWLIASIAPRFVLVGSAAEDIWADPESEMLSCLAASPAYEALGIDGFVGEDRSPVAGDAWLDGRIGYHIRKGAHYFSRTDWQRLIAFVNKHS